MSDGKNNITRMRVFLQSKTVVLRNNQTLTYVILILSTNKLTNIKYEVL